VAQFLPQDAQPASATISEVPLSKSTPQEVQTLAPRSDTAQPSGHGVASAEVLAVAPSIPLQTTPNGLSAEQLNALSSIIPADAITDPVKLAHSVQVLQQLATMGIPTERWPQIMQIMNSQQPASAIPLQVQPTATVSGPQAVSIPAQALVLPKSLNPAVAQSPQYSQPMLAATSLSTQAALHAPGDASMPSHIPAPQEPPVQRRRSRSRSPVNQRSLSGGQGHNYRHRSPMPSNNELQNDMISINDPKWTGHDPNLAPGNIKVLSRTLFVGGVK